MLLNSRKENTKYLRGKTGEERATYTA